MSSKPGKITAKRLILIIYVNIYTSNFMYYINLSIHYRLLIQDVSATVITVGNTFLVLRKA